MLYQGYTKTPTKSRGQFENIHRNDAKVFLRIGYHLSMRLANKKPPIKGRRLPMKAILKTNTIITQKNKKRTRPRRVTGTFLDILYQIKKTPARR